MYIYLEEIDSTNKYAKEVLSYVDNSYLKDLTGIDFDLQEAISMHEKVSKGKASGFGLCLRR